MAKRWKANISCRFFIGLRNGQARVQISFKTHTHVFPENHLENIWEPHVLMFFLKKLWQEPLILSVKGIEMWIEPSLA